ncbi:MAG: MATE family efflux transporter [Clostridia bacterium]|nr:MATE family efflux transporter [Clostridia bacterium]
MNRTNDLTQGVIWKKLISYFLPIAAGTLFQQLYNAIDAIIVGKFVGTGALAAVGGSPAMVANLLLGFFVALCGGAEVVISQHFGAKDRKRVDLEIHTSVTFCFFVGLILSAVVITFSPQILTFLKTPADTMADSVLYTRIYFSGSIFMLLFNMGSGILRAMGDSKRPFYYLTVSCVCNIILDIYFVVGLHMGVAGVAWATVAAQGISAVLVLIDLCRNKEYPLRPRKLGIKWDVLASMMRIGVPSGIQSAMYGLSGTILQTGVNTLGTVVVASWAMSGKLDGVYWAVSSAFGTAVMNFVGQNYGARNTERIRRCVKTATKLFAAITAVISGMLLLLAKPALTLFSDDPAVIETTWQIIVYLVPFYMLWTVIEVFSGVLRGVGDAVKPAVIVALGVCAFRVIWVATAFALKKTLFVICICYPISWFITGAALLFYYFKGSKFSKKHSLDS